MNFASCALASALLACAAGAGAQTAPVTATAAVTTRSLPAGTMFQVTPVEEVSSKTAKVGDRVRFYTVSDVIENGAVAIPRNTPVMGTVNWKTGRAIGGKSGKFEVTFDTISLRGTDYKLRGKHRQEGKGNTVGALLGSMFISGRSAVMEQGQLVNAFTDQSITY